MAHAHECHLCLGPREVPRLVDLALLAPASEKAPKVATRLLETGLSFAILMPADLVNWIAIGDKSLQRKVDGARKLAFLDPGLVWL